MQQMTMFDVFEDLERIEDIPHILAAVKKSYPDLEVVAVFPYSGNLSDMRKKYGGFAVLEDDGTYRLGKVNNGWAYLGNSPSHRFLEKLPNNHWIVLDSIFKRKGELA